MEGKINEEYIRQLVSKNLRQLRSRHNLSQLALSVNAGMTHNFLNDVENCKKGISIKTLAKLSAALKVEPYRFFLPDGMSDDKALMYINDFNDSMQKMAKDLTARYITEKQEK